MNQLSILVIASMILSTLFGTGCNRASAVSESAPKNGSAVYVRHCISCHGSDGSLGARGASDLARSLLTEAEVAHVIAYGKHRMPAFQSKLSEEEIQAVARYVFTLRH
ncbi:MAG: hypothetical protein KatS3mg031_1367 [Chitinophagales bacterium]|nr:MAG: hypothetical protein KatS3mg031_1367 [Chitinophagales bacterium]